MASEGKLPVSQGLMLMMMTAGTINHIMLIPIMLDKSVTAESFDERDIQVDIDLRLWGARKHP